MWKDIATAFKTINRSTIKDKISGVGFKQISIRSQFKKNFGVPTSLLNSYKSSLQRTMKINPKYQNMMWESVDLISVSNSDSWTDNDMKFTKENGGGISEIAFLGSRDEKIDKCYFVCF